MVYVPYLVIAYRVTAYILMAFIVAACIFMAYILMAYILIAYIVVAYIVVAYMVMAKVVMAYRAQEENGLRAYASCPPPSAGLFFFDDFSAHADGERRGLHRESEGGAGKISATRVVRHPRICDILVMATY